MDPITAVVVAVIAIFVLTIAVKSVLVIPQAQAAVIERLGRYRNTAAPGLNIIVPFIDKVRARIDLRKQVVSFPPQPVITQDNLTVSIDTVVYFQVTEPRSAVYEISNYIVGVEQLTITTLRNLVGGMSLEETLTSRDHINGQLRGVLDEATGRWGLRVARVELKSIDPPPSIQDSMEKQMRADREKRAMILTAEGQRESSIKTAEGQKQSQILAAEGDVGVAREALAARERLGSTGLGHGVAIPHGRSAKVSEARAAFVRLAEPIDFGADDGKPVGMRLRMRVAWIGDGVVTGRGGLHFEMISAAVWCLEKRNLIHRKPDWRENVACDGARFYSLNKIIKAA